MAVALTDPPSAAAFWIALAIGLALCELVVTAVLIRLCSQGEGSDGKGC
jgi:hypothetical protein